MVVVTQGGAAGDDVPQEKGSARIVVGLTTPEKFVGTCMVSLQVPITHLRHRVTSMQFRLQPMKLHRRLLKVMSSSFPVMSIMP